MAHAHGAAARLSLAPAHSRPVRPPSGAPAPHPETDRHVLQLVQKGLGELRRRPATQLPALDAIRAAAILLVVGGHYSKEVWRLGGGPELAIQQLPLFTQGWTGVDLFFILSGYLIGRQLWKELFSTGDVQVTRFILRRGFRIWPLYFAFLLGIVLFRSPQDFRWPDWLFLSNYLGGELPGGWSLSTEEQFYISVPLLLVLFKRRLSGAKWMGVLAGLLLLELAARKFTIDALRAQGLDGKDLSSAVQYQFHLHCEGLLIGLAIALASVWRPEWFRRAAGAGFAWLAFGIFVLATSVGLGLRSMDRNVFAMFALALMFGGFTLWALLDRSPASRPLASPVFYPVSRLSYGMYLNHLFFMPALSVTLTPFLVQRLGGGTPAFLAGLVLSILIAMAIAAVTFVLIEHPFLHLRERWLERRERARAKLVLEEPTPPTSTTGAGTAG
jgi:peptidoglycan/LPS O-acetylase OafA/YrhL